MSSHEGAQEFHGRAMDKKTVFTLPIFQYPPCQIEITLSDMKEIISFNLLRMEWDLPFMWHRNILLCQIQCLIVSPLIRDDPCKVYAND